MRAFHAEYNAFQMLAAGRPELMEREQEPADSSGQCRAASWVPVFICVVAEDWCSLTLTSRLGR